jgi:hypothetical protein
MNLEITVCFAIFFTKLCPVNCCYLGKRRDTHSHTQHIESENAKDHYFFVRPVV